MSTTRVVVVMVILMFGLAMSGCVQPGEDNGNDTNGSVPAPSPTPDPTPEAFPDPIPTVTPTPDNDIGNESNGSDDKLNWSTCDPRHNESWLYQHGCGMYASSGGGGWSPGSYGPPPPIPELPTAVALVSGVTFLIGYIYMRRQ